MADAHLGQLEGELKPHKRHAWVPKVSFCESKAEASKFSGIPALAQNGWPCCVSCQEPMQLFLQLNSRDLPESANAPFGEGFLQVFYCTNMEKECEIECEAFFPFAKSTLVRVVKYSTEEIASPESSPVKGAFPSKEILGWVVKDDYPNWEELENFGVSLSDERAEYLDELGCPLANDKLLGWPCWVQGVEYPNCPECKKPMSLVFQIDSGINIPTMFGDAGCSHITQCKEHPHVLAIAWACG